MDRRQAAAGAYPHLLSVEAGSAGMRLDRFVADACPGAGRAAVARLIAAGGVVINGRPAKKGQALSAGDTVALSVQPGPVVASPDPSVELRVLHEDDQLVVVDKPAGMPTHPLRTDELATLASGLLARYPQMADVGYHGREPGIVHRLDTGTSGLVLAARDAATFAALRRQLVAGRIHKTYVLVCAGTLGAPARLSGHLHASGATVRVLQSAVAGSRPVTLELLEARPGGRPDTTVVRVEAPFAGRHQIRAQLAAAGHPLVGDTQYGGPQLQGVGHHLLHAEQLRFEHPATGAQITVSSEPPQVLAAFVP